MYKLTHVVREHKYVPGHCTILNRNAVAYSHVPAILEAIILESCSMFNRGYEK